MISTKRNPISPLLALLIIPLLLPTSLSAGPNKPLKLASNDRIPTTLTKEARSSMTRGCSFLLQKQLKNGSWLNSAPITGLACIALNQSDPNKTNAKIKKAVAAGREFILQHARKDGAICDKDSHYLNYSTSVCLSALAILNNPDDKQVMRHARRFLIELQLDEDNSKYPTAKTDPYYGGIGYGSGGPRRPDLSNTQWALEALYLTDHLDSEVEKSSQKDKQAADLAWKNALQFLKAVQNIPEDADQTWVVNASKDADHDGGFIYKPGDSKATSKLNKQGKKMKKLLSYGSMTYAGLKSMIYAKLKKDDYRVKAARNWIINNYSLTENPGMGAEGHFYYLVTFAKANAAYGSDQFVTADGKERAWRTDLIKQLLRTQRQHGEWYNDNGRWMESIPELVTSYALISMEIALGKELTRKTE